MSQVQRIEGLCNFLEHPGIREAAEKHVFVTMPRDVGALGFDRPLWLGLGIVGVWAALDAYAERYLNLVPQPCAKCGRNMSFIEIWSCGCRSGVFPSARRD
jgi:hypothetical protein